LSLPNLEEDNGNYDQRGHYLKEVVNKLIPDSTGKDIEKLASLFIFFMKINTFCWKSKTMTRHGGSHL
jgi:hypothetical protein